MALVAVWAVEVQTGLAVKPRHVMIDLYLTPTLTPTRTNNDERWWTNKAHQRPKFPSVLDALIRR